MKKELVVFIVITLALTMVFHYKEFLQYPIQHLKNLPNSGVYGFGVFHPFIFSALVYIIFLIPRGIFNLFKRRQS